MRQFLVLIFVIPFAAVSQEKASINGYVKDSKTGQTLTSANIGFLDAQRGTSTDTTGYFSILNITPGEYTLVVSFLGYQTFRKKIRLLAGENYQLNIELIQKELQLSELVVHSEPKESRAQIGVKEMTPQFIKKIPAVFEADVFRALQLLPGVKASSDFSSGLYIRGGGPGQNLILLDGAPIYNPTHFFGFYSTFNTDAISNVELYKGGYPAKYGGRLGSVLSIDNKEGNREEFHGTASVGLLASRVQLEGPFKNGSWMIALRRSTLGPYLSVAKDYANYIPNKFYFWDLNGKFNFDINPDNTFSLGLYAGMDDVNFPFSNTVDTKLRYGNQLLSANWSHTFSPKLSSNLKLIGSRYFNYPSFNITGIASERTNKILDFSSKGDIEYKPSEKQTLTAGFRFGRRMIKYEEALTYDRTYIPDSQLSAEPVLALLVYLSESVSEDLQQLLPADVRTYIVNYIDQFLRSDESNLEQPVSFSVNSFYGSFYLQDELEIGNRLTIIPGIRINGYSNGSYWRLSPRLSVEYESTSRILFQAAYGRYNQFLSLITHQAFSGFDTWLSVNEEVKPEYGDQYIFGIKVNPKQGYKLDMEAYYRTMNNLFDIDPFLPDLTGLNYDQIFRFGKGYAYGMDLAFQKHIGRLTGSLGYSYSVTRRKYPSYNQSLSGEGGARFYPPRYDRQHNLKAFVSYKLSSRWKTTAVFKYATGQAYTRPTSRTRAVSLPFKSYPIEQLVIERVNASRLPPYQRLDIGFSRSGNFFGLGEAEWKFQLVNTYSYRNIWLYNYNFAQNPIQRDAVQMLPILPNISYTVKF